MIFFNNKIKRLLFVFVVLMVLISMSCVNASANNESDLIKQNLNEEHIISASNEIYISPNGTGSGESSDNPSNWHNAYSNSNNGDTIIFLEGNYVWNTMESIYKSLTLKGDGNAIINAYNQSGFLRVTAGNTLQLVNLTFYGSDTGDTETGAIVNSGVLIVNDCYFAENIGWGTEGGAIHNSGSCDIYNSIFFHNTAKKGGSIYNDKKSILNVYNSTFIKGSSKEGNCINVKESLANIYNCNFINCSAKSGIIYTKKGTTNIYNSNFTNSRAVDYAACVDVDKESYVLIENCKFDKCTSVGGVIWNTDGKKIGTGNGGAVYVEKGGSLTIKDSSFSNCNAKANGGALYIESSGSAIIDNCSFISNSAALGRHIYIEGTSPSITNSLFEVNDTLTVKDLNVDISVDVGTNFMNYNIPVLLSDNEVYTVKSSTSSFTLDKLDDGEYILSLGINDKSSTNRYLFNQNNMTFKVGNSSASQINQTNSSNVNQSNTSQINQSTHNNQSNQSNLAFNLSAPDVTLYYHNGSRFIVTLSDNNGNIIVNATIKVIINSNTYTRKTNSKGIVSLPLELNSGVYEVLSSYENISVKSTVNVLSTVNGTDITKVYRNSTQYSATFKDKQGKYLTNGTSVQFNINGVLYERTVKNNGVAKLNINLEQGNYVLTAMNPVTGENAVNNISVLSRIVENNDVEMFYRNSSQYIVKLIGDEGNPVGAGEVVTFNINGVFYNRTTNANGTARLNLKLQPNDYVITASYKGCRVSNNIKIKNVLFADDLSMKYNDGSRFKVKLVNGIGKPYPSQIVIFNINGVFYNRTTNSEGFAFLNIKLMSGEYIITSSYNGNNIANKVIIDG